MPNIFRNLHTCARISAVSICVKMESVTRGKLGVVLLSCVIIINTVFSNSLCNENISYLKTMFDVQSLVQYP